MHYSLNNNTMNTKNKSIRIGLLLFMMFMVFGIHYKEVKADIVLSQLVSTASSVGGMDGSQIEQTIGTNITCYFLINLLYSLSPNDTLNKPPNILDKI